MRVLLIQPSESTHMGFYSPPLWALYLQASLRQNGIDCDWIDGNARGESKVREAIARGYDVYGITVLSPQRWRAFDTATYIHDLFPRSDIVLGGAHTSLMLGQCRRFGDVLQGDAEASLVEYLGGKAEYETIDDLPVPHWNEVNFREYPVRGRYRLDFKISNGVRLWREPRISLIFSRGCKGSCTFCSSWWINKGYRVRSPRLMAAEVEYLMSLGQRHLGFADDDFLGDREKALELCRELKGLRIAWNCTARADNLDEELALALKEAGCFSVALGIETGDEDLLRRMHKQSNLETTASAIRACRRVGLYVVALMIVGGIGETDQTVERTVQFLKETKPNHVGHAAGLMLLPGTAVYQEAKRQGMISGDFWESRVPFLYWPQEKTEEWRDRLCSYSFRTNLWHRLGKLLGRV